jgi:hypothetical protein
MLEERKNEKNTKMKTPTLTTTNITVTTATKSVTHTCPHGHQSTRTTSTSKTCITSDCMQGDPADTGSIDSLLRALTESGPAN